MTDGDDKGSGHDVFRQLHDISRQNLSYLSGTLPPLAASLAKWNLEMLRFSTQRALEYRDLSQRMAQCRTPMEVWSEQTRFFENLQTEFSEEMGRLLQLLNGIPNLSVESAGATSAQDKTRQADADAPARDPWSASVDTASAAAGDTAEAARKMAGVASAAAEQVADDARKAMDSVDKTAPGASQAQAAISAAEQAATTIARQAEATAALVSGSAAAVGGVMAGAAYADEDDSSESQGTAESPDEEGEDTPEDAETAASFISESAPGSAPSDADDDDDTVLALEDETADASHMISEEAPEDDGEEGEDTDSGDLPGSSEKSRMTGFPSSTSKDGDDNT